MTDDQIEDQPALTPSLATLAQMLGTSLDKIPEVIPKISPEQAKVLRYQVEGRDYPEYLAYLDRWSAGRMTGVPLRSPEEFRKWQADRVAEAQEHQAHTGTAPGRPKRSTGNSVGPLETGKVMVREAPGKPPMVTEQALNYVLLPVNPQTGEINPYLPPLKVIWLLEALMDPIVRDPKPHTYELIAPDGTKEIVLGFRSTGNEVRNRVDQRFSYKELTDAFAWLLDWKIDWLDKWVQEGKKGGWARVLIKGTKVIMDYDVDVMRHPGRNGIDLILSGRIAPRAVPILLNNLLNHRFCNIPKGAYGMSIGAQRLYRQGLPFVLNKKGWRLDFILACRVLDYSEDQDVYNHTCAIEDYLEEIVKTVGWRRNKKAEAGEPNARVWYLRASKEEMSELFSREYHQKKRLNS